MANQIIIDIGAVANDGTGDPLRTAFGYVNNNFSNIWATGVANSNIQFDGNRILTTNTNGNLVLAPNGVGKVQANVDIVPNANNTLSLGSLSTRWNTVYAQNLDVGGNTVFNNLTVDGNLTVQGDIIQIGNIVTDSKTIQLANTAGTDAAANGSGITVGASDDIATLLYNSTGDVWTTNIGITAIGNVTAPYFIGNGSLLTGIESYGNANVAAYLPTYIGDISANNVFVTNDVYSKRGTFTGDPVTGDASLYIGSPTFTNLGTDVMAQFTGNVTNYAQINLQNYGNSNTASGDYIITADNGTDSTHFLNLGLTGSNWDGSQPNSLGNRLGANDGYLYVQDGDMVIGTSNGNIETWKFDQDGVLTAAGDIVPAVSNTQSLGNATNQWADLWVSNATIYMNSVPITLGAGNVLTVNGEALLSNDSNTSITTTGNITADTFFGSGVTAAAANDVVSLNAFDTDGNTVSIQAQGNTAAAVIETYFEGANNRWTWSFDNSGTLTFPASQTSIFGGYDNDFTINTSNTGNAVYTFTFSQFGDLSVPVDLDVSGNVYINHIVGTGFGNVTVTANTQSWLFDNNGTLTLPGNSQILPAGNTGVRLSAGASDATGLFLNNTGDAELYANSNVSVYTDAGNIGWTFDNTGNLNLPNNGSINFNAGGITQATDEDFVITVNDADDDGFAIFNRITDDSNLVVAETEMQRDRFEITLDVQGAAYNWQFSDNGQLYLPGNVQGNYGASTSFYAVDDGDSGSMEMKTISYIGDTLGSNIRVTQNNATISTGNAAYTWTFDNTGKLTLPGNIVSNIRIAIDNRSASDPEDIEIYSADDILIQARDLTTPGPTEGGDVNINAGDGGPDDNIDGPGSGGDVRLFGGVGGTGNTIIAGTGGVVALSAGDGGEGSATAQSGSGGDLILSAGDGGTPNGGGGNEGGDIYITAGATSNALASRGSIILTSGDGGDETTNGGYVQIDIPQVGTAPGGSWIFTGAGTVLETPNNAEIFNVNAGNLTVGSAGNTIVRTIGAGLTTYDWVFDPTGGLTTPGNITATGNVTGANLITAGSVNVAGNVNLTGAEGSDTARIFADVSGSDTSLVLEVGDDNADSIVLRHYSFAASNTIDMLTATRVSNTAANVSVVGNVNAVGGTFSGNVTAQNFTGNISITGNVTGTSPNVTLVAGSYSYTFDNTGILTLPAPSTGLEGGEIDFTQAANSTLSGNTVVVDQYADRLRFFESGGNTRGVYIDLAKAPAGVGGELQFKASGLVNRGVDVTLDNLKARIPATGNVSLQLSTVSGTYSVFGSDTRVENSVSSTTITGQTPVSITTTPAYLDANINFATAGATDTWVIMDTANAISWRISLIVGTDYNNNMITIERLV